MPQRFRGETVRCLQQQRFQDDNNIILQWGYFTEIDTIETEIGLTRGYSYHQAHHTWSTCNFNDNV